MLMQSNLNPSDPLSGALERLRFSHCEAGEAGFTAPWAVHVPGGHVALYAIRSGRCNLIMDSSPDPIPLEPGDFAILARGTAHRLCDMPDSQAAFLDDFLLGARFTSAEPATVRFVYGYFELSSSERNPLGASLPEFVRINQLTSPLLQSVMPLLDVIRLEQARGVAGWQAMVDELVHVLFIAAMRAMVLGKDPVAAGQPLPRASWLYAAMDAAIGPILGLIHSQPQEPWTVKSLAKRANMSRTAFSERFTEVVGQPPLRYVTEYRMQRACELLRESDLGVKQIALQVGYESASSFSSAFKRRVGQTPVGFRRGGPIVAP